VYKYIPVRHLDVSFCIRNQLIMALLITITDSVEGHVTYILQVTTDIGLYNYACMYVCYSMYRAFYIAPLVSNVPQKRWSFWHYAAVLTPYRVLADTTTQSSTVQPTPG